MQSGVEVAVFGQFPRLLTGLKRFALQFVLVDLMVVIVGRGVLPTDGNTEPLEAIARLVHVILLDRTNGNVRELTIMALDFTAYLLGKDQTPLVLRVIKDADA